MQAPEVFARNFGTQADMWSLGMLAYQTLSNRCVASRLPVAHTVALWLGVMTCVRCVLPVLRLLLNLGLWSNCRLPFWRDEDDMQMTSLTDVRSAVDEAIPLDYGPWLRASPQCRDFVDRLLQVGDRSTSHKHADGQKCSLQCVGPLAVCVVCYATQYQGCACVRC